LFAVEILASPKRKFEIYPNCRDKPQSKTNNFINKGFAFILKIIKLPL